MLTDFRGKRLIYEFKYLHDFIVIKFTEHSSTDLVRFERDPVEDRKTIFGVDSLLDGNS